MHKANIQIGDRETEIEFPIHVISHHGCTDGFGAFWASAVAFGEENLIYVPGIHGTGIPDESIIPEGSTVFILDFSYSLSQMLKLASRVKRIVLIDHHLSALKELKALEEKANNVWTFFDMERSGAGLTWDLLIGGNRPRMIDYIEDRDIWNNALDSTYEVGSVSQITPKTLKDYDLYSNRLQTQFGSVVSEGSRLLKARNNTIDLIAKTAFVGTIYFPGLGLMEIPMANSPHSFGSDLASKLIQESEYGLAGYFYYDNKGRVYYGFRSRETNGESVDVSELASSLGGGGHREAAGAGPFGRVLHTFSKAYEKNEG